MKIRRFAAALTGGCLVLILSIMLATTNARLHGSAVAQQPPTPAEEHRMLVFALANAIASVAVDSERNAMTMNSVASAGRLKSKSYAFAFENRVDTNTGPESIFDVEA